MKTIKIMIAASEEMHDEKLEFTNLIEHLNEVLEPRGIELKRIKWNPETDGSIEEFKSKLKECEMCLTLYWRDLVGNSEKELDTAYQELKDGNNPHNLYVFFKEPTEDMTEALKGFKANFVTNYGHFFCKFENTDTLNLQFILQFEAYQNRLEEGKDKLVKVKGGKVIVGERGVVNLDNVPFAALNKEYLRMKDELAGMDEQIAEIKELHYANTDDKQLKEEYMSISNKRAELEKKFENYQVHLYDIALGFAKTSGEHYSQRLLKARELFEAGNVIEADLILNLKEMKQEAEWEKKQFEQNRSNLELKMDEFRMKTDTIMANVTLSLQQRIDIVCEAFEEAISIAFLIRNDEKRAELMLEYAHFCSNYGICEIAKKYYLEAISASQWLSKWNNESPLVLESKACNGLAMLYDQQKKFQQAEKIYLRTQDILHKLIKENNDKINYIRLATLLNNMSGLHRNLHQYSTALTELEESLKIYEENFIQGEDVHEMIGVMVNLIDVYQDMNQYAKAEEYANRACQLSRDSFQKNPDRHRDTCLGALVETGLLYMNQHRFKEAEQVFIEADQIIHKNEITDDYTIHLIQLSLLGNLSELYIRMQRYNEAMLLIEQARGILKKLKDRSAIATINQEMALLANSILIFEKLNDYDAVKETMKEMFDLYHHLDEEQVGAYQPELAKLYLVKSGWARDMNELSEAKDLCMKALEIFRNLAEHQPKVYKRDVARSLVNLAILLQESDPQYSFKECENLYLEALEIYGTLSKTVPDVYLPMVANTLFNLAVLHNRMGRKDLAIKELEKQQSFLEQFVDSTGHSLAYFDVMAKSLLIMGSIYERKSEDQSAIDYLQKSLSFFKMADKACPNLYLQEILDVLTRLTIIMENDEQYEQAIAIYVEMEEACQNGIRQGCQNIDILPTLANILYNKGRIMSFMGYKDSDVLSTMNEAKSIYQDLQEKTSQQFENEIIGIHDFLNAYGYENN